MTRNQMIDKRNILLTLQLSVLGIVVVFGLFWILRSIRRLEDKLQIVMDEIQMEKATSGMWNPQQCGLPSFKDAEEAMAKLFASDPEVILTAPFGKSDSVVIEEPEPKTMVFSSPIEASKETGPMTEESVSEVGEGQLSKTKIKKMPLDQLRVECGKLSLAVDGTRKELMERLLTTLTN